MGCVPRARESPPETGFPLPTPHVPAPCPVAFHLTTFAGGGRGALCFPSLVQGGPVEILPFLYLGSAYHAARRDMLDALGITALLNVSSDCPNHFEGHYQYKCIPVEDSHKADISSWFMVAIEYIGRLAPARVLGPPRPGCWAQVWRREDGREEGTTCSWCVEGGT